jgi:hypothetical protein
VYNLTTAYVYDPAGNVLQTITNFDPVSTPTTGDVAVWLGPTSDEIAWIRPDSSATDVNQITCTSYDGLNRPLFVHDAWTLTGI